MPVPIKSREIPAIRVNIGRRIRRIVWQSRYKGCAAVAYVDGKAIAGISGPWADKYALTWWGNLMPSRQLELFDSLDAAKHEVEQRTQWADSGRLVNLFRALHRNSASLARLSWLGHVRALLRRRTHGRSQFHSPQDAVLQLRQHRQREDTDLSGMYFHAFD